MKCSQIIGVIILLFVFTVRSVAQGNLAKTVSLDIRGQRLDNVLEILSNKADFYFSYSSGIVKKDSLVNLSVRNKTVKDILNL